jgi:hypothetical protein
MALAMIIPLALANPQDPVSVDGVYDAEDHDDVVLAVSSQELWVEGRLAAISLVSTVASVLPETSEGGSGAGPRSVSPRAPPPMFQVVDSSAISVGTRAQPRTGVAERPAGCG